jgi:cytochrome c-type biogenesis protein CcmH
VTSFFIAAAALLLLAVALVVYPLFRGRGGEVEEPQDAVVELSRERLEELKRQKESGDISESEYAEWVGDLEAQLSDDLHSQGSAGAVAGRSGGRWVGIAAIVFIPVLSGLLYLSVGSPQALQPGATQRAAAPDPQAGDMDVMVARLAERLRENPDDAEGWFMLGRSYMFMNRYGEAADAFNRLRALVGDVPEVLVREATALAMTQGGALRGEPTRLVQRALEQHPDHPQALWMAATAAYQVGDHANALEYYRRVEPMVDGEQLQQVRGMIEELAQSGDEETTTAESARTDNEAPSQSPGDTASLKVNVALAPSMEGDAAAGDTVFIFARAVDGPPMPLSVVRKTVADLPVTVTLDDSQAMTPQFKLSGFDRVTVGARISSSGQPIAQPGDLEGESPPLSTSTSETVEITIDRVVPDND